MNLASITPSETILIIDDQEQNLQIIGTLLTKTGYQVIRASSGPEAFELLAASTPDLILLDMLMPGMNGIEVCSRLQKNACWAEFPIIFLTAADDKKLIVEALECGGVDYITKPFNKAELLSRVRTHLALKRTREQLRHLAEDKERVLDSSPDAICTVDGEGRFIQMSAACERIWGYRPEEMIGRPYNDFVHPEDYPKTQAVTAEIMAGTPTTGFENRYLRKDGTISYIWWSALWSDVGQTISAVARDNTERHQQDKRIAEQAALIDQAHDAILVRDTGGTIVFWSKGAERLYGWVGEEVIGRHYEEILQPDPAKLKIAQHKLDHEGGWSGELEVVDKTGARLVLNCRWTLLSDEAGQPKRYLHLDTDITEWKRIERHYLRAQRLDSIGTLASGVAHDLNNVLAPMMMALSLLRRRFPDPANQELLAILESSVQHGAGMVSQILSFSRGVDGLKLEVQIGNLITDLEKIIKETFDKNIVVRTAVPHDLRTVLGDPTQLHQVLLNLCVNARDAMPNGGTLTLSAENISFDENSAALDGEAKPGSYIMVRVEDTGTGMPTEVIEKIFDPFFTTKEMFRGTGLGLPTSMTIVKSHGGFLRLYSEVDKGTKFRVYLPVHTEPSGAELAAEATELPCGKGEWILVIDDDLSVREITKLTLETFGYRVLLASDGAEAVAIYAARAKEIAAVLTDMMMPVMDGPATIQVLLRINPKARIIGASGLDRHVAQLTALGVKDFLAKPYTAETLLRTLRKLLEPVA